MPFSFVKRFYARVFNDAQITYAIHPDGKFVGGVMRNYSVDGMCFISREYLLPGNLIDIQIMEHSANRQHTGLKGSGYGAEVIWCNKMAGVGHYLTGVRFYKPAKRMILQDGY